MRITKTYITTAYPVAQQTKSPAVKRGFYIV